MNKIKICGCSCTDNKGKYFYGIYIHNDETNTFTILNKKLEKVPISDIKSFYTCEQTMGNMFINL